MAHQSFELFDSTRPGIGPQFLGSREIPNFADLGAGARPVHSYALFCPYCARVWGMLKVEGTYCQPVTAACVAHAQFPTDGTFSRQYTEPGDPRSDRDLPEAVLRHDVLALIEFYLSHPQQRKLFL